MVGKLALVNEAKRYLEEKGGSNCAELRHIHS